jgi:hypothetical protein
VPYSTFAAKYALDAINESWTPVNGAQHLRPITGNSSIANSVSIRLQYAQTYVPGNLTLSDGDLADSYALVNIVDEDAF